MENIFTGTDLAKAFDAGAQARFDDMVEQCDELMRFNDVGEAWQFLLYYAQEEGLDTKTIEEKLK